MDARLRCSGRSVRAILTGLVCGLVVCSSDAVAASIELRLVGSDGSPVRDAVVSAHSSSGARPGPRAASPRAVMDQRDRQFVPHVLAIEAGTTVDFPNSDQIRHSIYSFSEIRPFEIKLYKSLEAPPIRFGRVGVAVLGCNIHDYMLGYVYVLDTSHFGVSDEQGTVRIDGLAAGDWRLRVRHPRVKNRDVLLERSVAVPIEMPLVLRLDVSPGPRPPTLVPPPDELQELFGEVTR